MIEYDNFQRSLGRLEEQYENYREPDDSLPELTREAITESVIRRFKTCYDCLWKVLKRYLIEELGLADVSNSPKPVFRLAYENELFAAPLEQWLCYADARVDTAHDYSPFRNHSPLEGESARQGRSPQPSRWGEIDWETNKWGAIKRFYTQQTLQKAKTLRESQTNAEGLLWHYLRDKQLAGYKFRRQQPIGPYIVDFACMPKKLLIELDGGQHAEQHTYDKKRDEFLQEKGYKILRFWNNDVFENCFGVLESIRAAVQPPPPQQSAPNGLTTATPPQGGSDWSVERARAYLDRMPPNLADLFPDCLVDSELGPIPEGWEVKALSSFGKVITGKTPSTRNPQFYGNDVPFLKIPDMHGKMYVMGTSTMLSRAGADFQTANGLPPGSISVSCIATPGLVVLNHRETHTNQQINSIIPNDGGTSKYLYWSCRKLASEIMLGGSGGSVFHNMNKSTFSALKILDAGLEVISSFEKLVCPMHEMVLSKEKQNHTLIAQRDALLPKLISGEIRIRDAETFLEQVR